MNRYTVTHRDLALYEACPRLLAAQAYLTVHPEERVRNQPRVVEYVEGLDGLALGSIGEAMTAELLGNFGDAIDVQAVRAQAVEALRRRNVAITDTILGELDAAIKAAQSQFPRVHEALEQRYGRLQLLGRGKAHYGHVPGYAAPDYVAVARDGSTILVDAKFQGRITANEIRQAEWYNAVANADNLQVKWVPQAGEHRRGTLQSSFQDPQECVLVNWSPTDGGVVPVTERANVNKRIMVDMWRIKGLGFKGRLPEHDCDSQCRCERFLRKHGLARKEGNGVVSRPPVVSLGQCYVEGGIDLEARGLAALAELVADKGIIRELRRMHYLGRFGSNPRQAVETLAGLLGIPEDRARELLQPTHSQAIQDGQAKVERFWKPLMGDSLTLRGIKAQATRTYGAAIHADRLVKRSNQFWDGAEG